MADVFLEMNGGRQQGINLNFENKNSINHFEIKNNISYCKRVVKPNQEEAQSHEKLIEKIKNNSW